MSLERCYPCIPDIESGFLPDPGLKLAPILVVLKLCYRLVWILVAEICKFGLDFGCFEHKIYSVSLYFGRSNI